MKCNRPRVGEAVGIIREAKRHAARQRMDRGLLQVIDLLLIANKHGKIILQIYVT